MKAPNYIQKELSLIDPLYFAVFNEQKKRWQVRKWKSIHPINHKLSHWESESDSIRTICILNYYGHDIGYKNIGMDDIHTLQRGLYWAKKAKLILQMIDEHNHSIQEKSKPEDEYLAKYTAKDIFRHYNHPRVFIHRGD